MKEKASKAMLPTTRAAALFLCMLYVFMLSSGSHAASDESPCDATQFEHQPQGLTEPVTLVWRQDGSLDVLSCKFLRATRDMKILRWAKVFLKGIRVATIDGDARLFIDTRDGPIDLGALATQPCLPKSGISDRVACLLTIGERTARTGAGNTWSVSLILGEEGGVASQALFSPSQNPEQLSEEDERSLLEVQKSTRKFPEKMRKETQSCEIFSHNRRDEPTERTSRWLERSL